MGKISRRRTCLLAQANFISDGARFVEKRRFLRHRAPEREARAAARLDSERQVVEDGEVAKDARDLVAAREACGDASMLAKPRDFLILEKYLSLVGGKGAGDLADE